MATTPKGYAGWSPKRKSVYWATRRKQKAALLDPSKPLSGSSLLDAAKASVDLETRPQVSALDTQARSARIQQGAVSSRSRDYYSQIASEAAGDVARTQAISDRLAGEHRQIGQDTQAALDRTQGVADDAMARDTGVRGTGLDGGGDERVRGELAAQRARAAATGQSASAQGANIGGNWEGLLNAMGAATSMRGGEVQQQFLNKLGNELSDIRTKKADVQALSGSKLVKTLTDMRQQAFENSATAQTLGQKDLALKYQQEADQADRALAESRLKETGAHNTALERLASDRIAASRESARAGRRTTQRGQNISHGDRVNAEKGRNKRAADKKAAGKKTAGKMPQSTINARGQITNLISVYRREGVSGKTADKLRKAGADNVALDIASKLAGRRKLNAADVAKLKAAYPGFQVPANWLPPRRQRGPRRVVSTR